MKQKRITRLLCGLLAAATLGACTARGVPEPTPEPTPTLPPPPEVTYTLTPPSPTPPPESQANLVPWNGIVEHLFFHPVVTYPELAFDGDAKEAGIDEYMVTLEEYNKILQNLYDKDFVIVDMNDVWSEVTGDDGEPHMRRNTLMIPEGKKPIILSYDDVCYYEYMLSNGFTYRLILDKSGDLWSYGLDPSGEVVISQDLDAITILDKFVREHPDFSLNGAKGCLCLTGYEGILGYRTQTDVNDTSAAFEENRQREIARVKPIIQRLKDTGWYFASHSWGHISLNTAPLVRAKADADRWMAEVGSLVGPTTLMVYPFGARLDGDDVAQTGPAFKYYQSLGFRVFASVGIESYSKIKTDISAVICDRMHADGGTLRRNRERYMKFYDAAEVWDDVRPTGGDYTRGW
jgi:hypothetical protein